MEPSATSIDLINVCVPGINFSKKDSPASLPNMEKESNTASILTLFLVPPLFNYLIFIRILFYAFRGV
ncbi:hypothetical protein N9B42_02200 [Akkermansiaceae bacterium]|nr:hypothetical protein [Akkermansiaceae bacterium]MDB4144042.1 hypothetical protein [Akkermansiaceae bacterium]MDB4414121.1 hypothetical protein [Akkermansiaceae bacterium]MDB4570579.1 hypothetical protein [Akkermansiaceae bacterium]